jgi:hypothetical protein
VNHRRSTPGFGRSKQAGGVDIVLVNDGVRHFGVWIARMYKTLHPEEAGDRGDVLGTEPVS